MIGQNLAPWLHPLQEGLGGRSPPPSLHSRGKERPRVGQQVLTRGTEQSQPLPTGLGWAHGAWSPQRGHRGWQDTWGGADTGPAGPRPPTGCGVNVSPRLEGWKLIPSMVALEGTWGCWVSGARPSQGGRGCRCRRVPIKERWPPASLPSACPMCTCRSRRTPKSGLHPRPRPPALGASHTLATVAPCPQKACPGPQGTPPHAATWV